MREYIALFGGWWKRGYTLLSIAVDFNLYVERIIRSYLFAHIFTSV